MIDDALLYIGFGLTVVGFMLLICCLFSRASNRFGIPLTLIFLGVGMLAGSDGLGGIEFEDYELTYDFGAMALGCILFAGGLHTDMRIFRKGVAPAAVMSTIGVALVAFFTALCAHLLGFPWLQALTFGAILSSTDASAVFSLFQDLPLKENVAATIEVESGLNDPMAALLTLSMTSLVMGKPFAFWPALLLLGKGLGLGALVGLGVGYVGKTLLRRTKPTNWALYPVMTLAIGMLAFGCAIIFEGSGFLAAYICGLVIGNADIPAKKSIQEVHSSISWLAQISMFLILGLLVFPARLPHVAVQSILIALFIAFIARPAAVMLCLAFSGHDRKERLFISWIGLRGAMPIILAMVPVLALSGDPDATEMALDTFNCVFFVVLVGSIIPGVTVRPMARRLGLLNEPQSEQAPL